MEKIYCSIEPWCSILGVNRPNGTSRTWNYQETGELAVPYTITRDMIDGIFRGEYHKQHYFFTDNSEDFDTIEIHDIEDKAHIYPIRVHNAHYFKLNLNTGFSCVSPKVLADVRAGKAYIVMDISAEGKYFFNPGTEFKVIERWREKEKLPEFSVIIFSGNLICDKLVEKYNLKLRAYPCSSFEDWARVPNEYVNNDKLVEFTPKDRKNIYLSFNRAPRNHRLLLGYLFWTNDLFKYGKISLGFPSMSHDLSGIYPPHVFDLTRFKKLWRKGPITIDTKLDNNLAFSFPIELFKSTFISVVTETLTDNDCIFFSEKIWKPIAIGHPFILLGNKGSLAKLKEMGYKTFDKWIDEGYDNENSEVSRALKITDIIKKLCSHTPDKLKSIRKEMEEVTLYNKRHFYKLLNQRYAEDSGFVFPEIDKIRELYRELL